MEDTMDARLKTLGRCIEEVGMKVRTTTYDSQKMTELSDELLNLKKALDIEIYILKNPKLT
jgi:hypothetical protein